MTICYIKSKRKKSHPAYLVEIKTAKLVLNK